MEFEVTFSATWRDRSGVEWSTGKQTRTVQAKTPAEAVSMVRSEWPEGAQGTCKAESTHCTLLDRVRYNVATGRAPSIMDDSLADAMFAKCEHDEAGPV